MILINCGGSIDLTEQSFVTRDVTAYVLDSHRPIKHENILDPRGRVRKELICYRLWFSEKKILVSWSVQLMKT